MFSVYALVDPRNGEVRYIGLTKNIKRRYSQHVSTKDKSNQTKQVWIDELKQCGLCPTLLILEEPVEESTRFDCERYWIQAYLERNANLTNMRDAVLAPIELRCSEEEMLEIVEQRRRSWAL
jgi:hypothetical protein